MKLDEHYLRHIPGEETGNPGVVFDVVTVDGMFVWACEAIQQREAFSVVRMSDGEASILDFCKKHGRQTLLKRFDKTWNAKYGVTGITCGEIQRRLTLAASHSTLFCPDGWMPYCAGFTRYFPLRSPLGDLHYRDTWSNAQRRTLLELARNVVVINRDWEVAEYISAPVTMVDVVFIPLSNWREADEVIGRVLDLAYEEFPLVLASLGPGSKHIAQDIATKGQKVVLDIGGGAPTWWDHG